MSVVSSDDDKMDEDEPSTPVRKRFFRHFIYWVDSNRCSQGVALQLQKLRRLRQGVPPGVALGKLECWPFSFTLLTLCSGVLRGHFQMTKMMSEF